MCTPALTRALVLAIIAGSGINALAMDEGRVVSHDEVGQLLDDRFGALPKAKRTR